MEPPLCYARSEFAPERPSGAAESRRPGSSGASVAARGRTSPKISRAVTAEPQPPKLEAALAGPLETREDAQKGVGGLKGGGGLQTAARSWGGKRERIATSEYRLG
jgi:hypothetical protein